MRAHTHACTHLPADEAPTDGHLFTFIYHSGPWLAVHHSILVSSPSLASALNPATHTLQSVALQCSAVCFCLCVHVCVWVFANVHALVYIVITVSKACGRERKWMCDTVCVQECHVSLLWSSMKKYTQCCRENAFEMHSRVWCQAN